MQYEIKAFDKQSGSALVRFWTEAYPDGLTYNVDVPIEGGAYVTGAALDAYIQAFAPHGQISRLVEARAIDSTVVEALVVPEVMPAKTPEQIKIDKVRDINKIKQDKLSGGFVFNGTTYPCDSVFQQQLTAFIVAWDSGLLPIDSTITIRTYDDRLIQLSYLESKALAIAILNYVQSIYLESWVAKDNI